MEGAAGGIVLAGGRSRRLGRDKASEPLLGRPLLHWTAGRLQPLVSEIVVVARDDQQLPELDLAVPVRVAHDIYRDAGPLGGIFAGLKAAASDLCIVVACDMPLVQHALLEFLLREAGGHDGAVPVNAERFPEPICAVYSRRCLPAIERRLQEGLFKITAFFGLVDVSLVPFARWQPFDPEALSLVNANTEESLARAAQLLAAGR